MTMTDYSAKRTGKLKKSKLLIGFVAVLFLIPSVFAGISFNMRIRSLSELNKIDRNATTAHLNHDENRIEIAPEYTCWIKNGIAGGCAWTGTYSADSVNTLFNSNSIKIQAETLAFNDGTTCPQ